MNIAKDDEYQRAIDASWRILEYRQRSVRELKDKLVQKGFSEPAIKAVIARLLELGYINDEQFAAQRFLSLQKSGKGPDIIRADLKKKGIDSSTIAKVMEENKLNSDDEVEQVKYLARRKLKQLKDLPPAIAYRRIGGFLARRGYSVDTIRHVLRLLLKNEEET